MWLISASAFLRGRGYGLDEKQHFEKREKGTFAFLSGMD